MFLQTHPNLRTQRNVTIINIMIQYTKHSHFLAKSISEIYSYAILRFYLTNWKFLYAQS